MSETAVKGISGAVIPLSIVAAGGAGYAATLTNSVECAGCRVQGPDGPQGERGPAGPPGILPDLLVHAFTPDPSKVTNVTSNMFSSGDGILQCNGNMKIVPPLNFGTSGVKIGTLTVSLKASDGRDGQAMVFGYDSGTGIPVIIRVSGTDVFASNGSTLLVAAGNNATAYFSETVPVIHV